MKLNKLIGTCALTLSIISPVLANYGPDSLELKSITDFDVKSETTAGGDYVGSLLKAYTLHYKQLLAGTNNAQDKKLAAKLAGYKILFVGGFMTDNMTDISANGKNNPAFAPLGLYFKEQIGWIKAQGLDVGVVEIESEAGVVQNGSVIATAIESSTKPVVIIAHSKGGLDTLEALLKHNAAKENVAGVITVQSPFYGTPIADSTLNNSLTASPAIAALEFLGGSGQSLVNLSMENRALYMDGNLAKIEELTAQVPWISFGSWVNEIKNHKDSNFELPRDMILNMGYKNDGLVPPQSAMLPGASWIVVSGVDHLATTLGVGAPVFKRVEFIKTMLMLLTDKIDAKIAQ